MSRAGGSAIDEPWARAIVGRARRSGWGYVGAGLVLFILVGFAANHIVSRGERLRRDGGQTQGVIVERTGLSLQDARANVSYSVAGRSYREQVSLGNHAGRYHVGQEVTVYYDPAKPTEMTIDDVDNESSWTALPMAVAFVLGISLMVGGAVVLVQGVRNHRVLRASAWRDDVTVAGSRGTTLYLAFPDGRLLRARPAPPSPTAAVATLRVAGAGQRFLVAIGDAPAKLIPARPAKDDAEQQRWRGSVGASAG